MGAKGKDELSLHRAAIAAHERIGNYWHMLPEAAQARKAIWKAVNPHTQRRRIDEAFPPEIRKSANDTEMLITFKNGATWQVVGSDNYNSLVGASPVGIVYSEWALANPAARAYLRPILAENNGWQVFITTARGRNHAYTTLKAAEKLPGAFAQVLRADQTGVFTPEVLEAERLAYIAEFGDDYGQSKFDQEYLCSFDAAIMGAFYGAEFKRIDQEERIRSVPYDEALPVNTAWDLGRTDDTAILFYQVMRGEIHIIDAHHSNGKDIDFYLDLIKSKPYRYGVHWLPHDAKAKTLASGGKSIEEQVAAGVSWAKLRIVPRLSVQDGIQACRKMLRRSWWDKELTENATEAMRQYHREWDAERKKFTDNEYVDWTNHYADAGRYLAIAWQEETPIEQRTMIDLTKQPTVSEIFWADEGEKWKRI